MFRFRFRCTETVTHVDVYEETSQILINSTIQNRKKYLDFRCLPLNAITNSKFIEMDSKKSMNNGRPTVKLSDINFMPVLVALGVIFLTFGKFKLISIERIHSN